MKYALILIILLLMSCTTKEARQTTAPSETATSRINMPYLAKFDWHLIQLEGVVVDMPQRPTLSFETTESGKLTGFTGCNRFFGLYEMKTDSVRLEIQGSTRMACREDMLNMETRMTTLLNGSWWTYDIADQVINLYRDNALVMMFARGPEKATVAP